MRLLVEFGFRHDSSLMGSDFTPYYARTGDHFDRTSPYRFGTNVDLVERPVSWILDDFPHFEHVVGDNAGLAPASRVEEVWRAANPLDTWIGSDAPQAQQAC